MYEPAAHYQLSSGEEDNQEAEEVENKEESRTRNEVIHEEAGKEDEITCERCGDKGLSLIHI